MDFKAMLQGLQEKPIFVALPTLGVVRVKITEIKEDAVSLEAKDTGQKYFLHYTSVIVVT